MRRSPVVAVSILLTALGSSACVLPVGTTTVLMDPAKPAGFFSMPWPDDSRRHADGSLDLAGFPGRSANSAVETTFAKGEAATFGFGTNSAVFFQTSSSLDPAGLPKPAATTDPHSPIQLIDLDHPGTPAAPIIVDTKTTGTQLRPPGLVSLLPYPGHPLRSRTRYAAVVFSQLRDLTGKGLSPSPLLRALDGSAPAGVAAATWAKLRAERDVATAAVSARTTWHVEDLVAFSVFSTQDVLAPMAAVTAGVNALPAPAVHDVVSDAAAGCAGGQAHVTAKLDLPSWQQGQRPFLSDGGALQIGANGRAVVQGWASVDVDLAVPCAPVPARGWPLLLYMNGTGAIANARSIPELGAAPPYVVASIAPVFSGDRRIPSTESFGDFLFFNYLNPIAGQTNQLQQAADMLWLRRAMAGSTVPATAAGPAPALDRSTVVVAGHSQGAITLPITVASDPTIRAAFISSGGGGLYHSIVHRGDVTPLVQGLLPVQPGEIDQFHPLAHVLQTFAEAGDAANYAGRITRADVALYGGLQDGCSPIESSVHLATALGVPLTRPVTRQPLFGAAAFEPPVVASPVSANLAGGRTGVLVELDRGHFGALDVPAIGRSFVASIAAGGPARVDPGPLAPPAGSPPGCDRTDPAPAPS
jgi:hypothetical protein